MEFIIANWQLSLIVGIILTAIGIGLGLRLSGSSYQGNVNHPETDWHDDEEEGDEENEKWYVPVKIKH